MKMPKETFSMLKARIEEYAALSEGRRLVMNIFEITYLAWRRIGAKPREALSRARASEYPLLPAPTPYRVGNTFLVNWRDPLIREVVEGEHPYHVSEWDDYPLTPIAIRISRSGREWWGIGWDEDGTYHLAEFYQNKRDNTGKWIYHHDDYLSWADNLTLREIERRRADESALHHAEEWGREREIMLYLAARIRSGTATQAHVHELHDRAVAWEHSLECGNPYRYGAEWFDPEGDVFLAELPCHYSGNLTAARRLASALTTLAKENLEI